MILKKNNLIKNDSIKGNSSNYILHTFILTMILFSASAFHSEENTRYYILIIGVSALITYLYLLINLKLFKKLFINGYFLWTCLVWFMVFMYGYIFPGLFHPQYIDFNLDYRIFTFVVIIIVIVLFISIPTNHSVNILIRSSAIASILLCTFLLVNEGPMIINGSNRIGESASGNANTVGIYLGIFFVLSLYKVIFEKAYLYVPVLVIQTSFMLLTGSKKAFLFIVLGIFLYSIFKNRHKLYKYIIPLFIIAAIIYLSFSIEVFYNILGSRLHEFVSEIGFFGLQSNGSYSTDLRWNMILIGVEAFLQSPIWGNGWFYFSEFSGLLTYSHNNYIEILVTHGLLGILLYYSLYIIILFKLITKYKEINYAALFITVILMLMINDVASVSYYDTPRNYILLLFAYKVTFDPYKISQYSREIR